MSSKRSHQLPVYNIPPEVVNASFSLFGLTMFQMVIIGTSLVVGLVFMISLPLDFVLARLIFGGILIASINVFFLLRFPVLTPFEQVMNYVAYWKSNIPRKTQARPLPRPRREEE